MERARPNLIEAAQRHGMSFAEDPLWYKDAVIYQLHIKSYFDANNDGIGDFPGLIQKLDYIAELGVNTIWLLPFYPSPRRDDGYDIADYRGVHPDYGTMGDFKRFVAEAHRRGLRVITELVVNHTSDQHPWFQRARLAKPGSAARNFYVWSDNDLAYADTRIIFCDTEKSNWTWDPVANAFFWHRFYSHQPDLNFDNPQVLKAVLQVMGFWLDLGVDGLRLDAVPYLIEREGTSNENLPETHAILKRMRADLDANHPNRMLLAEANMWPEDVQQYFGDADECHMAFHFPLMPRMYMALAQEDRFPITDILRQTPDIPPNCQWAIFLRNHDELTLEMVTDKERDYLWNHYASDKRARINLGIRRRLTPLMQRDRRRVELLNSFLLSMPGTPVLYYGDEIGMGDNIHLGDRDGVRTPMQWSPDRNAGFSRANPASLVLPPIMDPVYGYQSVNVEAQSGNPYSLLNWMRRMLAVRKQHHAFGRGKLSLLYPNNRKVLAYLREHTTEDGLTETILCVANVSQSAQAVELDLSSYTGRVPAEMVGGSVFPPIGQLPYLLTLPPYGFYWFLLATESAMPSWHTPAPEPLPEYRTLVLRQSIDEILAPPLRTVLEQEALPAYLPKRRWYASKQERLQSVRIARATLLPQSQARPHVLPTLLVEVDTATAAGTERYFLPLGMIREEDIVTALPQQLALARLRRGRRIGLLTDAFVLDSFSFVILDLMRAGTVIATDAAGDGGGKVCFIPTAALAAVETGAEPDIRRLSAEQSNSSLVIADKAVMKLIRHVAAGIHPEAEMGRYLTALGYANAPAMLGEVTRFDADGTPNTLIMLQQFIDNQGDAWQWTLDTLTRAMRPTTVMESAGTMQPVDVADPEEELKRMMHTLGRRLGELHAALATPTDDPGFAPQPAGDDDMQAWAKGARAQLDAAFDILRGRSAWDSDDDARCAERLLTQREALLAQVDALAAAGRDTLRIRIHGDFHLGQVLVAQGDVYIVDFEGEPARSLAQRREKSSPLRDVAGLLRSIDYAAAFAGSQGPADLDEAAELRKQRILDNFAPSSKAAFLAGYRDASQAGGLADGGEAEQALLQLFIVEKAAYEICYEAANRPAWIPVPLRGLAEIADGLLNASQGETPDA
jgi:maltose alpha-D-glucosyltransferase/alpha-amylase